MAESSGSGMDRRQALLRLLGLAGLGAGTVAAGRWLSRRSERPTDELVVNAKRSHTVPASADLPQLAVIAGGEPEQLVRRALQEMGGIKRFISRSDVVIVKPNIAWDRTPEQAANTNPQVIAELVRQCWDAGAKKVIVTDVSCNDPRRMLPAFGHRRSCEPAKVPRFCFPNLPALSKLTLPATSCRTGPYFSLSSRPTRSSMSPSPSTTASPASPWA